MNISIIHLSDFHLKENKNDIANKIENISKAIKEFVMESEYLIIVVTGDIAYSGKSGEYKVAGSFLSNISLNIKKHNRNLNIEYIIVPGNHDCNLELHTVSRDIVIDGVHEKIDSKDENKSFEDSSIIDECTEVQKEYFQWLESFLQAKKIGNEKLFSRKEFSIGGKYLIRFNCFNTAWLTKDIHRHQPILFPLSVIHEKDSQKVDIAFSILHHPYNWLESEKSRRFKNEIEKISNIVITGHEHEAMFYEQKNFTGERNQYMEGGPLQVEGKESCFNLLFIDLEERKKQYFKYCWHEGSYKPHLKDVEWEDIPRSKLLEQDKFIISASFHEKLIDPGTPYKNPRNDPLYLGDIYVYPDLEVIGDKGEREEINDKNVKKYLFENKHLLILGPENCGKTSILKMTYLDLVEKGIVPVYIEGEDIVSAQSRNLKKLIDTNFIDQYSGEPEDYSQLDNEKKVIMIDNINQADIGVKGKRNLIEYISKRFERIIFTSSDIFEFEQLIAEDISELLLEFKHCVIQEFGKYLTNQIIERWYILGQEEYIEESKLARKIKFAEDTIDTIIGPNLLPFYPFFLLTITQSCEGTVAVNTPLSAEAGSFGYYYEWLITNALSSSGQIYRDINAKYNYLAELAFLMFRRGEKQIYEKEILEFHEGYRKDHTLKERDIPFTDIITDLITANILYHKNGYFEFKYKYIHFYFIAREMDKRLQDPATREEIVSDVKKLIDNIIEEVCAYILIFLSYKSQDPLIRSMILEHGKEILKNCKATDLDNDVKFINSMNISGTFALRGNKPKEEKKELLKKEDELKKIKDTSKTEGSKDQDKAYKEMILPINNGIKTIQVMGQILKNFAGSLLGVDKYQMARECYLLGLRTMKYTLDIMEQSQPDFIEQVKQYRKYRDEKKYASKPEWQRKGKTESQLDIEARIIAFIYADRFIYLHMKNLARSVGLEKLELVFDDVLKEYNELLSVALVDVAIKLESFSRMPTPEVMYFADRVEHNNIIKTTLRHLVWTRMRLYGCGREEQQKLCNRLGIPTSDPRLLMGRRRKVRARLKGK